RVDCADARPQHHRGPHHPGLSPGSPLRGRTRPWKQVQQSRMPTIRQAVDALEERLFVGRERDLESFRSWLERPAGPTPEILNVHGPGGVGKSALLAAFRRIAAGAGRTVALVDGRAVPATPAAFPQASAG